MRQEMTQAIRNTSSQAKLTLAAFIALAVISVFAAAPAKAGGNEFDDGFQDQLGRLVAGEVFHLGKWVLAGGPHGHYAYAEPVHYRSRHERRHARRHHRKEHRHYWRLHHGHAHGYGHACHQRFRERGHHGRYDRRDRRDWDDDRRDRHARRH